MRFTRVRALLLPSPPLPPHPCFGAGGEGVARVSRNVNKTAHPPPPLRLGGEGRKGPPAGPPATIPGMNLDHALDLLAREPSAPVDLAEVALCLAREEYPDVD